MSHIVKSVILMSIILFFTACGGSSNPTAVEPLQKGYVVDSPIVGLEYSCGDIVGVTDSEGMFECRVFPVTFKIGSLIIGSLSQMTADQKVYPQDIVGKARTDFSDTKVVELTRFLQSLDDDGDIEETITITPTAKESFVTEQTLSTLSEDDQKALLEDAGKTYVAKEAAMQHLKDNVEKLTSIMITPSSATISLGESVTFKADGSFSNGATRDISSEGTWSSSDSAVASLDGTKAQAASIGTTTIMISHNGISKTATLTVTAASLSTLDINATDTTLAEGTQTQLAVMGTYSDSTTSIMTSQVSWSSSDSSKATVDANGLVTAVATGSTTITASKDGVSEEQVIMITDATLTGIALEPIAHIAKGLTGQLAVTGTYTNGQTQTLTSGVDFNASDVTVATVNSGGLVTAVKEGTTTIMIRSGELVSQVDVTVLPAVLSSIIIDPLDVANLANGKTTQLTVTGTYSDASTQDVSSQVTWSSTTPTLATVNAQGLVTAVGLGSAKITATLGALSNETTIMISDATLESITVTSDKQDIAKGLTGQLHVSGLYSDSATADLISQTTWTTSDATIATVSSSGVVSAKKVGTVTVTGKVGAVTAQTTITISDAVLQSIAIKPLANNQIAKGNDVQLEVTGTYSDSSTQNISEKATWSSTNNEIIIVSASGIATGQENGSVTITGTYDIYTAHITIECIVPTAYNQFVHLNEDTTQEITLTGIDINDTPLIYAVITQPSHGLLSGIAPELTYTPNPNYNGTDNFTFKVNDSEVATINITVFAINDAPIANAGSDLNMTWNQTVTLNGLLSTDVDNQIVEYKWSEGSTVYCQKKAECPIEDLSAGEHHILLTVKDAGGKTSSDTIVVYVKDVIEQLWIQQYGTSGYNKSNAVATDSDGNVYIAGTTMGSLDGNTNIGGHDVFLSKFNAAGIKLWTKQYGGQTNNVATSMTVDDLGNIYLIGTSNGEFDGYPNVNNAEMLFLTKFNKNGEKLWTKTGNNPPYHVTRANSITIDYLGNVYLVNDIFDYINHNGTEYFEGMRLTKYDSGGNYQWTRSYKNYGGSYTNYIKAVITDSQGNVYAAGETNLGLDGNQILGATDIFITKYDSEGNNIWTQTYGTLEEYNERYKEGAVYLAVDKNDNIYIAGYTYGALDNNINTGGKDIFLTKEPLANSISQSNIFY